MVKLGMALYGEARYGMVRLGRVRYGEARYGMVGVICLLWWSGCR